MYIFIYIYNFLIFNHFCLTRNAVSPNPLLIQLTNLVKLIDQRKQQLMFSVSELQYAIDSLISLTF